MQKLAVIADDLTGANDTGVQFAKQGLTVEVLLGSQDAAATQADIIVIDTNSRAISSAEAYRRVAQAAAIVKASGIAAVYKKIDSTLRGNLGAEIDAIMDTCGQAAAIVAPAYPQNGRCVIGGYHLLNNIPLEATEIARDPRCPVKESHIPTLIAEQTRRPVGHLSFKTLLKGEDATQAALEELIGCGKEVIVCDAWEDKQLALIAAAAANLGKPVLWVGSAGLAQWLPTVLGLTARKQSSPVLVIAGSVSGVTRGQVAKLKQNANVKGIEVDARALLAEPTRSGEVKRCCAEAAAALREGYDVVIASGYAEEVVEHTKAQGAALGYTAQQVGDIVAGALGEIGKGLASELTLAGMVLTGGDIAVSVCRALGAASLSVASEVAPGIPVGFLTGGLCDGLKVVTKAGAFGGEDALVKAVHCLKS
ncbi:type III effector Hrp-dependent outers [Thermosinus carboxydivorans Nor1]|uniref:Type III effector Hrp-dependent outers n=1 Tax=Thermosinus carboxydivorans Nor1 TaxID=401526 RepID=A1HLP5_9FIRM|nr:four-carbon acid sugar kinase family protein [Thermosinus carboxydivorans]EAX48753.1 type III effector Hrp-dependent outers [Thermosinus carboxydivorans Nor1]